MTFYQIYNGKKEHVDQLLLGYFNDHDNPYEEKIHQAVNYSLRAGGKRLRPVLFMEVARLFACNSQTAAPFACALEMIHTYSLIHDDLPAMDNDDLRRGMPTSHIKFGEAMAILAGDSLLNSAHEIMIQGSLAMVDPTKGLAAMQVISQSAGSKGMILGQVADIENENKSITIQELDFINKNKTGALIRAAIIGGAILAGASQKEIDHLDRFATYLGLSFQIVDDILDIEGDVHALGKPIGSDADNHKTTYPILLGLEQAKEKVSDLTNLCHNELDALGKDVTFLKALTDYMASRKN